MADTMSVAEIIKWAKPIEDDLRDIGIPAGIYKRPPIGKDTAAVAIDRNFKNGLFRFWPGGEDSEFEILDFDYDLRQALIAMKERRRTISGSFRTTDYRDPASIQASAWRVAQLLKVNLPSSTLERASNLKIETTKTEENSAGPPWNRNTYSGTAEMTVPALNQIILVGYDEKDLFISGIRGNIRTIKQAHEALKPKGLPKNHIRVGEFFLVPTPKKDWPILNEALKNRFIAGDQWSRTSPTEVMEGNHVFSSFVGTRARNVKSVRPKIQNLQGWATGVVMDSENRHDNVLLEGWHSVHRNNERQDIDTHGTGYWD